MSHRTLYLAGPITGLSYAVAQGGWRQEFSDRLMGLWEDSDATACEPFPAILSPMRGLQHLAGTKNLHFHSEQTLTAPRGCLARDESDIRRSDLVVMCLLGAERVSIGSMVELGMAHILRVPVLLIAPDYDDLESPNPHQHGWVYEMASYVVHTLSDGVHVAHRFCMEGL